MSAYVCYCNRGDIMLAEPKDELRVSSVRLLPYQKWWCLDWRVLDRPVWQENEAVFWLPDF